MNHKVKKLVDQYSSEKYEEALEILTEISLNELSIVEKQEFLFYASAVHYELDDADKSLYYFNDLLKTIDLNHQPDRVFFLGQQLYLFLSQVYPESRIENLDKAIGFAEKVNPDRLPDNSKKLFFYQKGLIYQNSKHYEKAVETFRMAYQLYEEWPFKCDITDKIAECYVSLLEYNKAELIYKKAIEQAPSKLDVNTLYLKISLADIYEYQRQYLKALNILNSLIVDSDQISNNNTFKADLFYTLGVVSQSCHNYSDSLGYHFKALLLAHRAEIDLTKFYYQIALVYRRLKRYALAQKVAKKLLTITNDDDYIQLIYVELYFQNFEKKLFSDAKNTLLVLINKYPNYDDLGWAYLKIGQMDTLLNQFTDAIEYLKKAEAIIHPEEDLYVASLDLQAYCHYKLDEIDKALTLCLKINKKFGDLAVSGWAHAILSGCYLKKGMLLEARDEATQAMYLKDSNTEAYQFAKRKLEIINKELGF
jgi:tetratricopeptide (TPR) repeat protein